MTKDLTKEISRIWNKSTFEQRTKFLNDNGIYSNMNDEEKTWSRLPAQMKEVIYYNWVKNVFNKTTILK